MFLDDLEREFILEDMDVVNEFETASFLSAASSAIHGKVQAVSLRSKLHHYSGNITKAVESISDIHIDTRAITEFLSKFHTFTKLNDGTYTVRDIGTDTFGAIKPQYLEQYVNIILKVLDKTVNDNITDDEIMKYAGSGIVDKVKHQIVTKAPMYSAKDLVKSDRSSYTLFNEKYVREQLIPFVNQFAKRKNALIAEATAVQHAIKEAESSFDAALSAVQKLKASRQLSKDTVQKLDNVTFNVLYGLLEVLGYVSFVVVAKLNQFGTDVLTAERCYYDVQNAYPDDVSEGAMDTIFPTDANNLGEDIESGQVGAFSTVANSLYEYHSNNPLMGMADGNLKSTGDILHSVFDMEIDLTGYSKEVYDDVIKMYLEIGTSLDIVAKSCDDYLMIFTDIRKDAGFILSLEDRFRAVLSKIEDVSCYSSDIPGVTDNNVFRNALAEIHDFEENMNRIASTACDIKAKFDYIETLLERNVNGEFKDAESLNEYRIMLDRVGDEFTNINKIVGERFMVRLRKLGEILTDITTKVEDPNTTPDTVADLDLDHTDYRKEVFKEEVEKLEKKYKSDLIALEASYMQEKSSVLRGLNVVLELSDASASSTSTDANNQQNTATPNNNNANPATPDAGATDATGATNASTPSDTTGTSTGDQKPNVVDGSGVSTGNKVKDFFQSAVDSISSRIKKFIATFLTNMSRSSAKNTKWVQENQQALLNRSYDNTTLNITPYKNVPWTNILQLIDKTIRAVDAVNTPVALQGISSQQDGYDKVFSGLPNSGIVANRDQQTSGSKTISTSIQIENYFKVGSPNGAELVAYSNNDLKNLVETEMIPFCQRYANEFTSSLQKKLEDLGAAADRVSKTASQSPQQDASDNTGNMVQAAKWINDACIDFSTGVLNAVRHRNNDYLRALSSLKPKDPVTNQAQISSNPQENQAQAAASSEVPTAQAQAQEPVVSQQQPEQPS